MRERVSGPRRGCMLDDSAPVSDEDFTADELAMCLSPN